ncbi:Protein of unknown function [Weissella confusa LBAE C39-2]|nr:Protein of unknown function [Weissella confusa LBAE C39-2]
MLHNSTKLLFCIHQYLTGHHLMMLKAN